jgi:amidase
MNHVVGDRIARRTFLAASAAGGAALLAGRVPGLWGAGRSLAAAPRVEDAPWIEATIAQLQQLIGSGQLSSLELTKGYLGRIKQLNPLLHAIIETNPQAIGIAAQRDAERKRGIVRGPLHGIPIVVKDNIATADRMETTAGSLALLGSRVPQDAPLVQHLRQAGAVILGKANLSEWANFRGVPPPDFPFDTNFLNGWSARGGFTLDPYLLSFDPCGSSSGSAAVSATNLAAAAVGTETDGSIVCPSGNQLIAGLKPTVGLISQGGIIPIAHSQDSAGPMARTVQDVATLLNVLAEPTFNGQKTPDYTQFLQKDALKGARIGIERRLFLEEFFALPEIAAVVDDAITVIANAGATIVDPVDTGDPFAWNDAEFTVLLFEFKHDIEAYLSGLRHTSIRTLGDLIQFNIDHCEQEMKFFGQEIFEAAESTGGNLSDSTYLDALALGHQLTREQGIDRVMQENDLDAVLSPSYGFGSSAPAVAGYPVMSVPVGFTASGIPAGVWLYAGFLQEASLITVGYGIEQALQARTQPKFAGSAPPEPPDAGICAALQVASQRLKTKADVHQMAALHRGKGHHMFPGR